MSSGHRFCTDRSGNGDQGKRTEDDDVRFAQSFEKLILMAKSKEGAQSGTVTKTYDKENKKPVIKASICNGEQVVGFKDIHTGKIEEIMLIKNQADLDAFKKMYGIDDEIEKEY